MIPVSQSQPNQAHSPHAAPFYPVAVLNGYLTKARNRANPPTDIDHAPREFQRYINGSGYQDVQLWNGLRRKVASGRRISFVGHLYAANPRVPGQMRDNYAGMHKHGIGPLEFANIYRQGPGSQPQDQGGVRQFAGDYLMNPGTSLWPKKPKFTQTTLPTRRQETRKRKGVFSRNTSGGLSVVWPSSRQ